MDFIEFDANRVEDGKTKLERSHYCCMTHYKTVNYWTQLNKSPFQTLNYIVAADYLDLIKEQSFEQPELPSINS